MDILEEIDETINEKKGKWNYTPMREKSETDALIDELLKEFSSEERPSIKPLKSYSDEYNKKTEMEERREFEGSASVSPTDYKSEIKPVLEPGPELEPEPGPELELELEPEIASESESEQVKFEAYKPEENEATQIFSREDIAKYESENGFDQPTESGGYDEYNGSQNDNYSGYGDGGFDDDYYDENDFEKDCDKIQTDELDDEEYAEFEEFIERQDSDLRIIKPKGKKNNAKTAVKLICTAVVAAFTIIGILSSALYLLEQAENAPSESQEKEESLKEEISKVIYPFVATDLDSFESPDKIADQDLVKLSLWEIIISLNGNMSVFKEDSGDKIIIPHTQIEYAASKLLGLDKKIEPCDIKYAGVEIHYDKDKKGYIIPENPDIYTFYPQVTSVKEEDGVYTVGVECFSESPKWAESKKESPIKKVAFTLKKTSDYYNILAAWVIS